MLKKIWKRITCKHEYVEVCRVWSDDKNRPHEIDYECIKCGKYVEIKMSEQG